jgi:C1A family cysteine protease
MKFKFEDVNIDKNSINNAKKWSKCVSYNRIDINNAKIKEQLNKSKPILISIKFDQGRNLIDALVKQLTVIKPSSNYTTNGNHMMVIVGYDDNENVRAYKVRNSWGVGWGRQGYCYLSYDFFEQQENQKSMINNLYVLNLDLTKFPKTV